MFVDATSIAVWLYRRAETAMLKEPKVPDMSDAPVHQSSSRSVAALAGAVGGVGGAVVGEREQRLAGDLLAESEHLAVRAGDLVDLGSHLHERLTLVEQEAAPRVAGRV